MYWFFGSGGIVQFGFKCGFVVIGKDDMGVGFFQMVGDGQIDVFCGFCYDGVVVLYGKVYLWCFFVVFGWVVFLCVLVVVRILKWLLFFSFDIFLKWLCSMVLQGRCWFVIIYSCFVLVKRLVVVWMKVVFSLGFVVWF